MIGRVENIERSVAEFVVSKLGLFQRRLLMNDDEGTGVWGGAYGIVDEPSADHLVSRQEVRDLPDVPAGGAIHSTAASMEPRSVGKDRRFHYPGLREAVMANPTGESESDATHALARTVGMHWPGCSDSRYLVALPDTRM